MLFLALHWDKSKVCTNRDQVRCDRVQSVKTMFSLSYRCLLRPATMRGARAVIGVLETTSVTREAGY